MKNSCSIRHCLVFLLTCLLTQGYGAVKAVQKKGGETMQIRITSVSFLDGAMIPKKHTCDGENISPQLEWTGVPETAKSLALICDDPDAPMGTWVHWVMYCIPVKIKFLKENQPRSRVLEDGSRQGQNDSRKTGYDGPCPPGGTHRYFFRIFALDTQLTLEPGALKTDLLKAMNGHIIAEGQLMGRYKRD